MVKKVEENIRKTCIWQRIEYPLYIKRLQLTDKKTSTNKKELMIKTETSERRYTKEQEACKKVLSIFSYQGNANKSHNEIPAHTQQNKIKKTDSTRCWGDYGANGTLCSSWNKAKNLVRL